MKKIMLLIKQIISNKMLTNNKNYDIINYNKGENTMSKVKQWAEDTAEKAVDNIIAKLKDGQIDLTEAVSLTMKVENVNMLGIDENNVEEALTQ